MGGRFAAYLVVGPGNPLLLARRALVRPQVLEAVIALACEVIDQILCFLYCFDVSAAKRVLKDYARLVVHSCNEPPVVVLFQ